MTKWCSEFSEGRTDVQDEQISCRPSLISDELLQAFEGEIRANRRVTIRELYHTIPEVSKITIHNAVLEKLGYRKLCAHWVPKILTDDHKMKGMGSALKFWTFLRTFRSSYPAISTCFFTKRNISQRKSSTTIMRCKKKS